MPLVDWQKEFNVKPEQLITITITSVDTHKSLDNMVEVDGKIYELDISEDLPMAEINASLGGFDFLKYEPDVYSVKI